MYNITSIQCTVVRGYHKNDTVSDTYITIILLLFVVVVVVVVTIISYSLAAISRVCSRSKTAAAAAAAYSTSAHRLPPRRVIIFCMPPGRGRVGFSSFPDRYRNERAAENRDNYRRRLVKPRRQ